MATLPFSALPKVLNVLSREIPKSAHRKLIGTAARILGRELVTNTPVDEGDARSAWVASVAAPSNQIRDAYAPYPRLGSATKTLQAGRFQDIPNAANAIAQHNSELQKFNFARPGTSFFFVNNQPYIVPLEQGKLKGGQTLQNSAGWVERSIAVAAQRAIKETVIPKGSGGGRQFTTFNIRRGP